jgi:hypothetical protein
VFFDLRARRRAAVAVSDEMKGGTVHGARSIGPGRRGRQTRRAAWWLNWPNARAATAAAGKVCGFKK